MQECLKIFKDVVDYYKLDMINLSDYAFAICMADNLEGSNKKELSVDRLIASDIGFINIFDSKISEDTTPLPKVQCLRILCDVLVLALYDKNIEGVHLTSQASTIVANKLGYKPRWDEYSDEEECIRVLKKFKITCKKVFDFSDIIEIISKYGKDTVEVSNRKLYLPNSIKSNIEYCKDYAKFVEDEDFETKYRNKDYIMKYLFTGRCQSIINNLIELSRTNYSSCCTKCIKINKILKEPLCVMGITHGNITKVLNAYLLTFFKTAPVKVSDGVLEQYDKIEEIGGFGV